jgi:hypothetical protein
MQVKSLIVLFSSLALATNALAFEILALGTSNTNCKGANQAYTKALNEMLEKDGIKAVVINGGKDGDTPLFMMRRMSSLINGNTKLVIFEPGPNERDKQRNLADAEKILDELLKRQMPTIYVSHNLIESDMEALTRAQKYDAAYYGRWNQAVPTDRDHRQYDQPHLPNSAGHMTEKGCRLWASNIYPLIKRTIEDKGLR